MVSGRLWDDFLADGHPPPHPVALTLAINAVAV